MFYMYLFTIVTRPIMVVPVLSDKQQQLFSGPMALILLKISIT